MGNMIGSGIYLLPSSLARYGGISILGWLFTATGSMILALIFSRLSRLITKPGGPYIYTQTAFGDFAGFIVAWGYWISIWCGNAAISTAMVGYLRTFIPALNTDPILSCVCALSSIWILTWINILGIRKAGFVQVLTTILKIIPLVVISFIGVFYIKFDHFTPFNASSLPPFSAITSTAAITLWAFLGLESASIPAEDIKTPEKNIPKATILGTLFTALIYILSTFAVMGLIHPELLMTSPAPFAEAAKLIWGKWAGHAVAAGAVVSCLGALNGWILLQGQLPRAASIHGLFPSPFKRLSSHHTPIFGLIFSSILVTLLISMNYSKSLVHRFTFIIMLATLATLIPYLFCSFAELSIRIKRKTTCSKKEISSLTIVSIFAFLYSCWAVIGLGPNVIAWGMILLSAGMPFYIIGKKYFN